jgi:hypothetical protein
MGSSLGGLISHFIGLKYQDVFSKAGVFSPSFWFNDSCYSFAYETGKIHPMRYYMMGGTNESGGLVQQMSAMIDTLHAAGFDTTETFLKIVPGGQHNELLWRTQFGQAYEWMFLEGATDIDEIENSRPIRISVVSERFALEADHLQDYPELMDVSIYSITGHEVFQTRMAVGSAVYLPSKLQGIYIVHVSGSTFRASKKLFLF